MKITDRKPKAWIAVCCMVSLLFCSLSQASKPEDIYMTNADCLSLQVNNEYHTMVVSGYHPQRNAPHYQLVLPPGFIYQEKIYYIEKVAADVFAGQTFSQIYVMTEKGLSIGDQAFFNAKVQNISGSSVTDHAVEFEGDSLLGVGDYAFAGLQADSRFTIENMAGSIGVRAFENAVVRGTLTIGGQIGTLGVGAFSGTIARDWMLTADIRRVEEKAFQNANVQEFTIGESLQYLGSQAFQGSDLTRLYLPDGRFQGVVAQDAIPDKEGLTIVIPGGDTNLSAFHFENFQNAVFEVPASLPEDSAVMQFLRENQLQWKKTENTPAPDGDGSTPVPGGDGSTPAPSGSGTPVTSQPGGVENTPMPDGDGSTPAPSGSGTPVTSQPGGVKNTPAPNGGFVKTDQGNGDAGTQQGSQHKDTNAHNGKKYFTSKKIKYRMTSGNQVAVRGGGQ